MAESCFPSFFFFMSSSPTPEGHRPEPSQSSLLERDWEWLVWEGRTCCCRVEQLSVCATVDTLPYLCRLFYFYFALFIADRTTFVMCCCTQIASVFILSPSFFCLLLLSYCSLLNKHPPSPSMCILPAISVCMCIYVFSCMVSASHFRLLQLIFQ